VDPQARRAQTLEEEVESYRRRLQIQVSGGEIADLEKEKRLHRDTQVHSTFPKSSLNVSLKFHLTFPKSGLNVP
jgi:hypothetical protein